MCFKIIWKVWDNDLTYTRKWRKQNGLSSISISMHLKLFKTFWTATRTRNRRIRPEWASEHCGCHLPFRFVKSLNENDCVSAPRFCHAMQTFNMASNMTKQTIFDIAFYSYFVTLKCSAQLRLFAGKTATRISITNSSFHFGYLTSNRKPCRNVDVWEGFNGGVNGLPHITYYSII